LVASVFADADIPGSPSRLATTAHPGAAVLPFRRDRLRSHCR